MIVTAGIQAALSDTLLKHLGPDSPLRNVIMALATLVILVCLHKVIRGRLARYLERQAHKGENAQMFLRVFDIVYNPIRTRLLKEAGVAGAKTIGGVDMLAWQGVLAFEKWIGRKAPVELMRKEAIKLLQTHEN